MKLFKLSNGVLELDREEVTLYRQLRVLLIRDKDSEGRKKLQAFREFLYIYLCCDFESYPNRHGLNEQETHNFAIDQANLPSDYIPDSAVIEAMDFYVSEDTSIVKELITELNATFRNNIKIVRKLRGRINDQLINALDDTSIGTITNA